MWKYRNAVLNQNDEFICQEPIDRRARLKTFLTLWNNKERTQAKAIQTQTKSLCWLEPESVEIVQRVPEEGIQPDPKLNHQHGSPECEQQTACIRVLVIRRVWKDADQTGCQWDCYFSYRLLQQCWEIPVNYQDSQGRAIEDNLGDFWMCYQGIETELQGAWEPLRVDLQCHFVHT